MARHYIEDAVNVGHNGVEVASRGMVNLIDGSNVTLTVSDNAGTDSVDVTVAASGGSTGLVKLFDSTLAADAASIDTGAGGLAGGHGDLLVYLIVRTADAAATGQINVTLNADGGAHYGHQGLIGSNAAVSANASTGDTFFGFFVNGNTAPASYASCVTFTIPRYDQTTFNKALFFTNSRLDTTLANQVVNTQAQIWASTAAITRITVTGNTANLKAGSSLVAYGCQ